MPLRTVASNRKKPDTRRLTLPTPHPMLMNKHLSLLACAALAASSSLLSCSEAAPRHEGNPVLHAPASYAGDRFALNMFRELAATQSGNITFSPASLEAVLHLLRAGAAGSTRAALDALPLGQQGIASAMQVKSANALFVAEDMSLKTRPADLHRAPFATQPGRAVKAINAWCDKQTRGLVPEIATEQDIDRNTRLVALNAVYLKETWLRPFDAFNTDERGRFTGADGRELMVPLMYQSADFRYAEGEDWQAVALFYRRDGRPGEPGCFIGILPRGDARAFARELSVERYDAIRRALAGSTPQRTSVALPKMDIDSGSVSLKSALEKQGLSVLFGMQADFSNFADEDLFLSNVLQRCHIVVSEKETEAAAVTMGVVRTKSAVMPRPQVIHFTRPFIWAIGDLTTAAPPYFIGLCESPAAAR